LSSLRWRRLAHGSIDLHAVPTNAELFVYLAHGDADLIDGSRTTRLHAGALIVIPAQSIHVSLRPVGSSAATLGEFALRP
jgi:hypothetical protein